MLVHLFSDQRLQHPNSAATSNGSRPGEQIGARPTARQAPASPSEQQVPSCPAAIQESQYKQDRHVTRRQAPWLQTGHLDDSACTLGPGLSLNRGQMRHQSSTQDVSKRKRTIAVGISGGVDSAVAAMLLKDQGYALLSHPCSAYSLFMSVILCPNALCSYCVLHS